MHLAPGTRLGVYEVLAPLGAGGMGEVYRARDTRLGRDVALKILPEAFASDPERLARFEREARTLASLNHPSIAQIHGLEEADGRRAIVMELVDGEDLSVPIARGPMPLDDALAIARTIADALEAAHDAGIVHRDLKPANIKVRADGSVKVLDFGLAKAGPTAPASSGTLLNSPTITSPAGLTMGGVILGTAAYMAPEQAKGKPVDKRADIWAFGCVLYEMVTGRRPFDGEDITDTIAAVVSKEPDWSSVPPPLTRLLQQCLQKDPRRRLRDIGDAWVLLDERRSSPTSSPARGTLMYLVAAVAAIAIVVAAALAFVHFREQPPAGPEVVRLHLTLPVGASPDSNMQISPDGRCVAFLGRGADGVFRVYLRALDELEARPVPGTEQATLASLFWSPDSHWIAFASQGRLKKIDLVGGGPVHSIADVAGAGVIGGAWNRDGVMVFGSNPGGRPGSGGMFKVSADGGRIEPITVLDVGRQELGHRLPAFLPDGRRFLYMRASYDAEQSGIYVGDIDRAPDAQSSTRVLAAIAGPAIFIPPPGGQPSAPGRLLFFRANALMVQPFDPQTLALTGEPRSVAEPVGTYLDRAVFSATPTTLVYTVATGALEVQLRWFDASDQTTGTAVGVPGAYTHLALSPDATRAVVSATEFDRGARRTLWMMDFARGTRTRLTFLPGRHRSPIWSPDGKTIFYVTDLADGMTIYRKPVSGGGEDVALFKSNDGPEPTSVSKDGRLLLFTLSKPGTRLDIWALPLEGEPTPYPIIATRAADRNAQLSPDRRWIAYVEQEPTGRADVFVRPLPSPGAPAAETKWQVSTDGGDFPSWLDGGRRLSFFTTAADGDTNHVMVVDVTGTADGSNAAQAFQWGPPRPLLSLPRRAVPQFLSAPALTEDGKRLLAGTPVETTVAPRPLTVVLNWLSGVGQ